MGGRRCIAFGPYGCGRGARGGGLGVWLGLVALAACGPGEITSVSPPPAGTTATTQPPWDGEQERAASDGAVQPLPQAPAPVAAPVPPVPPPPASPQPPPAPSCGALAGQSSLTCSDDGMQRVKCGPNHQLLSESCSRGCLRPSGNEEASCIGTSDSWSCTGTWGTKRARDGEYYATAFGCWTDASGRKQTDSGDNCYPGCMPEALQAGICRRGESGMACEQRVNWYVADSGRFGCLQRLRITNPKNRRVVVAVALDFGPNCSVERRANKAVLDVSGAVSEYLLDGPTGVGDRALLQVVEVANTTPLGPVR